MRDFPWAVAEIHRAYAQAGARYHITNTFRTQPYNVGDLWKSLAAKAVELARESIGPEDKVCGSVAPLIHCYRPKATPPDLYPPSTGRSRRTWLPWA